MSNQAKVALITGASKRIGAVIVNYLHQKNINIVLHYRHSQQQAEQLQAKLNAIRADSVVLVQADLQQFDCLAELAQQAFNAYQRLDILVNNASSFYPTPIGQVSLTQWNELFASNVQAAFFLSQALTPYLKQTTGCIINIADIYAIRPLSNHTVYSMAKSALLTMTLSLAKELGPDIRVNAIAPGAILWPEQGLETSQQQIIAKTALKRLGKPADIAKTVAFLALDADYITGQIIAVDGGRSVVM